MTFTIALAQVSPSEDKRENLKEGLQLMGEASEKGVELLVLPEFFMANVPAGAPPSQVVRIAEEVDGDFVSTLGREARKRRMHVVIGIIEKSKRRDKVHDTVVMVGPDGKLISAHRKLQLFDSFGFKESRIFEPASDLEGAFDTKLARMGLMTCYELRFPEMARILALQGAELVVVPSAWVAGRMKEDHLRIFARARALENTVFVAVASQTERIYTGRSVVVDPFGVVVCDAGEEVRLITTEIDVDRVRRVRESLPSLGQIRNDVYSKHTQISK